MSNRSLYPILAAMLLASSIAVEAAEPPGKPAPVRLIFDTDMSGDCDDAGALALLHALADRGECELLAVVTNRKDKTNASAAAVDAINTYYGRPDIPIGTDKQDPVALQRTSPYAPGLRDGFPNDIGPDDRAPDALDVFRRTLAAQPDGSVTICSVGSFTNLADLCRREADLVRKKVRLLVVMGGHFPTSPRPETNIATHPPAAKIVAEQWPGPIVWHGFEVGVVLITGAGLKQTPSDNPVRRSYELKPYGKRPAIDGGQPSWDQGAALYAVRGAEPAFWEVVAGGRVRVDERGLTTWTAEAAGPHAYVKIHDDPARLAAAIEALMVQPPKHRPGAPTGGVIDTSKSPHVKVRAPDHRAVRWTSGFWAERFELCRRVIVPNLHQVLMNPKNSASFCNLQCAAGVRQGEFFGNFWGDGDCYKWIEAAAAVYDVTRDPALAQQMDNWIAVVAKAQAPDGYISTQMQLTGRKRWEDLKYHELYNMGHLLTAACIHYRATGKDNFLAVARKLGDYLCGVFEPRPKELAHFCFNPSNIMGAAELYRTTRDPKYLKLAATFVDMRGSQPGGSDQNQAAVRLRKEQEAVGHAVTATYLWAGAADVYAETGDKSLLDALERLWRDVVERKMYVTGAVGALHHGESQRALLKKWPRDSVHEAFGGPYQLPNRTAYNETCANIGHAMWNWRMLGLTGDAKYADVMERVLYNSMLSGMGVDGKTFFYTNPLRRDGAEVPLLNNDSAQRWPDTTPQSPVHCFCCPPSVARTIAEVQGWAYGLSDAAVWVHLYGGSMLDAKLPDGATVRLTQTTDYPWDGRISVTIDSAPDREMALMLRIPGWARHAAIAINGKTTDATCRPGSYVALNRRWSAGDRVQLDLPLEVTLVEAHPLVEETRSHVAVMRGPIVYCLESVDLPAGVSKEDVRLPRDAQWTVRHERELLRGVTVLETKAAAVAQAGPSGALYRTAAAGPARDFTLRLIPYYAWCNRGPAQMVVWIPRG